MKFALCVGLLACLMVTGCTATGTVSPTGDPSVTASADVQTGQPSVEAPSATSDQPCGTYDEPQSDDGQPVEEIACNRNGTPVFGGPDGSPRPDGVPARIPFGTHVHIMCITSAADAGMASVVNFYVIADGPWAGTYGSADTFWNGGMNNDLNPRVPRC